MKSMTKTCAAGILAAALHVTAAHAEDMAAVPVQRQGDVAYVSGGIGDEERTALKTMRSDYNLRVTSADNTGHFSGDTRLIVSDAQNNKVLDTSGGPLFYVNLPDGRYRVEAYNEDGSRKTQAVNISNGKTANVQFRWL